MNWRVRIFRSGRRGPFGYAAGSWDYSIVQNDFGTHHKVKLVDRGFVTRFGAQFAARRHIKNYLRTQEPLKTKVSWWRREYEYNLEIPPVSSRI